MNRNTLILISSITIVILVLLLMGSNFTNNKIETAEKNRKERNALQEIIDSTNNEHPVINESIKGKTIVLNVWATWCGPCRKEIPELNKLVNDFKSDNILFVALDKEDSIDEVKVMTKSKISFDYQLLFDQKKLINRLYSFSLDHEQNLIPLNMVINDKGNIEFYYFGNKPDKLLEIRDYLGTVAKGK